jgi:Polyketide cyclase / dehydrase and lipid transport
MSIAHMQFNSQIAGSPDVIFDLIADMPKYGRWLPDSDVFGGTISVTPDPVCLGTTYLDAGQVEKPGEVTEFDPPRHISFHHVVQVRKVLLKTDIDARIRYSLTPNEGGTFVLRELHLVMNLPTLSKLASPIILRSFHKENVRTLACLKRYVEQ